MAQNPTNGDKIRRAVMVKVRLRRWAEPPRAARASARYNYRMQNFLSADSHGIFIAGMSADSHGIFT